MLTPLLLQFSTDLLHPGAPGFREPRLEELACRLVQSGRTSLKAGKPLPGACQHITALPCRESTRPCVVGSDGTEPEETGADRARGLMLQLATW